LLPPAAAPGTVTKLWAAAWGVHGFHGVIRALKTEIRYDQLDLANLAMMEVMLMQAQLIEWVHRDGIRDPEVCHQVRITLGEHATFTSSSHAGESFVVSPGSLVHVTAVVARDANIMQADGRVMEEWVLRLANPKKGGGGRGLASSS